MGIGERLRIARKKRKITQREVAACLGVSGATISDIERGKIKKLSVKLAELLETAYGIDAQWLLTGVGKGAPETPESLWLLNSKENLTPQEYEIISLYLSMSKEERQQILLKFAISVAQHYQKATEFATEFSSEFESKFGAGSEYFDKFGKRINFLNNGSSAK